MSNDFDAFNSWKTLLHSDKCDQIIKGEMPVPVILHIYPTNKCNGNCPYCIMKTEQKNNKNATLSEDVFIKILKAVDRLGIKSVQIVGGGEPLLYPYLDKFQTSAFKLLSTNGSLLELKHVNMFDRIRISLNAGTEKVHQKVSGMNNFDEIIFRINQVIKQRKNSTKIGLGFVAYSDNVDDLWNFCLLAEKLKIDFIHIRPAYFSKNSEEDIETKKIMKQVFLISEAARERNKIPIFSISEKFDGFWTERQYSKCRATPLQAVLSATGEFIICLDVFIRFGNLYTQSFEEAWNSKEHFEAIEKINLEKCPRCVLNKSNEIIEKGFINDLFMRNML